MSKEQSALHKRSTRERIDYLHRLGGVEVLGCLQARIRGGDTRNTKTHFDLDYGDPNDAWATLSWERKNSQGQTVTVGVKVGASRNEGMFDSNVEYFIGSRTVMLDTTEGFRPRAEFCEDMKAKGLEVLDGIPGCVMYAVWCADGG